MFSTSPTGAQACAGITAEPTPPCAPITAGAPATATTTATVSTTPAPAAVSSPGPPPPAGRAVRHDPQVQQVADLLLAPGHHTRTGGCVSEPATAARATAAAGLRRSLTIVTTNAGAACHARGLRAQGLAAEAYPKLNSDTCRIWDHGPGDAEAAGLPVASLFCPTCPHRQGAGMCSFVRGRDAAEHAPHLVVTSHRASRDPAARAAGREAVVFVNSHPCDTLRPARSVSAGNEGDVSTDPAWSSNSLRLIHAAAETIIVAAVRLGGAVVGPTDYWPWVQRLAREADTALRGSGPTNLPLPGTTDPATAKLSGERNAELWTILQTHPTRPAGAVTRAILAAAGGELEQLIVYPAAALAVGSTATPKPLTDSGRREKHRGAGTTPPPKPPKPPTGGHLIEAHRLRHLPSDIPVVALGDHNAGILSWTTGVRWDATAGTGADVWARVTRILRRVTSVSRPAKHLDRVRLMLKLYPGRVGVLAHPNLLQSLKHRIKSEGWSDADKGRVVTAKWFAQDPDHLAGCDVILGLGAPRPHRVAVFKRLLQAGDPAAFEEPGWGELVWAGVGVHGLPALVAGHGYGHPAWQAADREIAVGVLRAWLGGTACPVVLVADDRLDVPLGGAKDHGGMTAGCERVLVALTAELVAHATPAVPDVAPDAVPDAVPARAPDPAVTAGLKTAELATWLGESERTVRHWMAELAAGGLVGRANKFAGWTATAGVTDTGDDLPAGCRRVLAALREEAIADSRSAASKTSITETPTKSSNKKKGIEEKRAAGGESARSGPQLARLLGLPPATVRKHLNRLTVLGVVRRARGKGARGAALWTLTRLVCPNAVIDPAAVPANDDVRENAALERPGLPFVAVAYAASVRAVSVPAVACPVPVGGLDIA